MGRELLPRGGEVELAVLLCHLDGLTHDSLHFIVISHLDKEMCKIQLAIHHLPKFVHVPLRYSSSLYQV